MPFLQPCPNPLLISALPVVFGQRGTLVRDERENRVWSVCLRSCLPPRMLFRVICAHQQKVSDLFKMTHPPAFADCSLPLSLQTGGYDSPAASGLGSSTIPCLPSTPPPLSFLIRTHLTLTSLEGRARGNMLFLSESSIPEQRNKEMGLRRGS